MGAALALTYSSKKGDVLEIGLSQHRKGNESILESLVYEVGDE
jgi:hypothetical protein